MSALPPITDVGRCIQISICRFIHPVSGAAWQQASEAELCSPCALTPDILPQVHNRYSDVRQVRETTMKRLWIILIIAPLGGCVISQSGPLPMALAPDEPNKAQCVRYGFPADAPAFECGANERS